MQPAPEPVLGFKILLTEKHGLLPLEDKEPLREGIGR